VAGILVGAAGMALLVWPDPGALVERSTAGIIAVLISGFAWAAGTMYARYSPHHPNAIMAAAQQMIVGAVALLAIGVARGEAAPGVLGAVSASSFLAFLYLTIFGSLVAFSVFAWLITVSTPARLSTTAFVNPMVAVILGWAILGETLASRALGGATLIVCAVVLMTVGLRPLRLALRPLRGLVRAPVPPR
jgi:drug/metabolite transporter (DMT)-like permease